MQTESALNEVAFRPMLPSDEALVFSSWLNSYQRAPRNEDVPGAVYFREQHRVIGQILSRGLVCVACNAAEPTQILGYIVFESAAAATILHYAYVKAPFRKLGIGRELLSRALGRGAVFHSHSTTAGARFASRLGSIFNPYLAG